MGKMRVIVTGGTGLIGSELVASLAKEGHEVIVLSRNPRQPGPMPDTVRYVRWDARTADGWGELANGADAIVNLAGENIAGGGFFPSRWTDERKRRILESRINAGKAVTEAVSAAAEKPSVVIQSSAVDYYDSNTQGEITEDSPPGDDFLSNVCKQWEASTAAVEGMGVRRVVIRTGPVLSKEAGALPPMVLPFRFFVGGPVGSGKQPFPWIHLADVVGGIRFLMENSTASGPFNLTAPNPLTNAEFAKEIGRALNRPSLIPVPGFALKLAFGEVADILLEGVCAVPRKLLDMGYEFHFPTAIGALRDIYS